MKIKSLVTFIRKELGYKGKSEHSGRGFYWMSANDKPSCNEVLSRVKSRLPKWQELGLIEDVKEDKTSFDVLFRQKAFNNKDEYYRLLCVSKKHNDDMCTIGMVFPGTKLK